MKLSKSTLLLLVFLITVAGIAQNKILFDATKAEMAGNADWIIDADANNIFFSSTTHLPYVSAGSSSGQSNPQQTPSLPQSGISASTLESYWTGALSAWAVDCVKHGYIVESLPFNKAITYGNSSNPQDLSNYKVFVVDEPNMLFSASEKIALINFIANGGGLMMISDHTVSDRNNDGHDSPEIWNDFISNNSIANNAFGIIFDLVDTNNFTSYNVATLPTNTIIHGVYGAVTQVQWSSGTTMTLNSTINANVKGLVYKTGANTSGTANALVASSTYLNGKVVAIGDSSIPDDGTGDNGDTLYNGYTADANGNHRVLLMNAMIWLMTPNLATDENSFDATHFTIAPNPTQGKQIQISFSLSENQNTSIVMYDTLGREVKEVQLTQLNSGLNFQTIDVTNLESGLYVCKLIVGSNSKSLQLIVK